MAKTPAPRTKARKGKHAADPMAADRVGETATAEAESARTEKPARTAEASAGKSAKRLAEKPTKKAAGKVRRTLAGKPTAKRAAGTSTDKPDASAASATPVVVRKTQGDPAAPLPTAPVSGKAARKAGKRSPRRPAWRTFLVAATLPQEADAPRLCVYAVVARTPAKALAAVRDHQGADVPIGLTGKLSGRMAKALGLTPGEVRRI